LNLPLAIGRGQGTFSLVGARFRHYPGARYVALSCKKWRKIIAVMTTASGVIVARTKRNSSNSIAGAIDTMRNVTAALPPPTQQLTAAEMQAYNRVLKSRELSTWSEHDVALATQMAQMVVLCEEYTTLIKTSGPTVTNANGTPVANPLLSARDSTFRSITQITKLLGLSASQKGFGGQDQAKRNTAERHARTAIETAAAEHDELI
jgi:hypothetical protein